MSLPLYINLKWAAPFREDDIEKIACTLQDVVDKEWEMAERCVTSRDTRRRLIPSEIIECVRNRKWDYPHLPHLCPCLSRYCSYSPLSSKISDITFSSYESDNLRLSISAGGRSWPVVEGVPIDDYAENYRGIEFQDLDEDVDIFWEPYFRPVWPDNARVLLKMVSAVRELFPLLELQIDPQIAEPERYASLEYSALNHYFKE
ncbi:hypothetical protein [Planctomicrobium piriforme]|uniref:Uncharacterized protein n=1 Tax=Planctomicrobium piriforme TaxID=1576369 RepID=A0A1I3FH88_9PLAN|nr:hypothetical protein [Planctomicrobium piriforme]SFI10575.1 hypothetical protein SAMN05421753_105248 [Planctomicrobium piriforme]